MPAIPLPASGHRPIPWKNGLGISYTIADAPKGAGFDAVDWQVSSTAINGDCPFSELPGLDRTFMVIEGRGVELTCVDGSGRATANRVEPLVPFDFRGDWRTTCRLLAGPVKVFNVMTRRGRHAATIELVPGLDGVQPRAGETLLAVALPGLDAWLLDGPVAGAGRAVLVRVKST